MDKECRTIIWGQFGAAIDTLENAIVACPDELWFDNDKHPPYWALVHHTLFWLDYYLSESTENFAPPAPFGMEEMDPAGVLSPRPYTKEESQTYLEHCRKKCRDTIASMTDELAAKTYDFRKAKLSFAELLLYNLRHVQHGAAQLNLILRQTYDMSSSWVFRGRPDQ